MQELAAWERSKPPDSSIRDRLRVWEREQQEWIKSEALAANQYIRFQYRDNSRRKEGLDPSDQTRVEDDDEELSLQPREFSDRDEEPQHLFGARVRYQPGDIISIPTPSSSAFNHLAVYIQSIGNQCHYYDMTGKYRVEETPQHISFHPVSGLIDQELLKPFLPFLPTKLLKYSDDDNWDGPIPREVAEPVYRILANFGQEASEFYQKNQKTMNTIYDLVADERSMKISGIDKISLDVLGLPASTLSPAQRFAVHLALVAHLGISPARYNRGVESTYIVRSKDSVERLENVVKFTRLYQEAAARAAHGTTARDPAPKNPLYAFVEKARTLILKSRRIRKPTTVGSLGSSLNGPPKGVVEVSGETFSATDREILELLLTVYASIPFSNHYTLRSVAALIVRAIGAYPRMDLDQVAGYMLLQELGVLEPWVNPRIMSPIMSIPSIGTDLTSDELYNACQSSEYEHHINALPDRMADLRKDWGNLPVFCVDSADTIEVDDGFSIEPAPGNLGMKWIHVHIADPTSFLAPEEFASKLGKRALSSFYAIGLHVKMLPTATITERASLAPNRPALTISSLISADGSIEQVEITPSIVRHVIKLTPDQLREKLLGTKFESKELLRVGSSVNKDRVQPSDDWVKHMSDFEAIRDVAITRVQKKQQHPDLLPRPVEIADRKSQTTVEVYNADYRKLDLTQSHHVNGDPTICLRATNRVTEELSPLLDPKAVVSDDLVNEIMQTACEAAASWCNDRGIPAVYSGMKLDAEWPLERLREHAACQELPGQNTGLTEDQPVFPTTSLSSRPLKHFAMGVDHYMRISSPLRRYYDLLNHWQINAYLRAEADGKLSEEPSMVPTALPFSEREIDEFLMETVGRENQLKTFRKSDTLHWKKQAFFRAFYFEGGLPEILDARVYKVFKSRLEHVPDVVMAYLSGFHLKVEFSPSKEGYEGLAEVDDVFEVKILSVNPIVGGTITVEALGPPITKG